MHQEGHGRLYRAKNMRGFVSISAPVSLERVCRLKYGKSLPARVRDLGDILVYGSNGITGGHNTALSSGPTIVIGRKGSVGEVHYSTTLRSSPVSRGYTSIVSL